MSTHDTLPRRAIRFEVLLPRQRSGCQVLGILGYTCGLPKCEVPIWTVIYEASSTLSYYFPMMFQSIAILGGLQEYLGEDKQH